jgi:hypothetical protein
MAAPRMQSSAHARIAINSHPFDDRSPKRQYRGIKQFSNAITFPRGLSDSHRRQSNHIPEEKNNYQHESHAIIDIPLPGDRLDQASVRRELLVDEIRSHLPLVIGTGICRPVTVSAHPQNPPTHRLVTSF